MVAFHISNKLNFKAVISCNIKTSSVQLAKNLKISRLSPQLAVLMNLLEPKCEIFNFNSNPGGIHSLYEGLILFN